MKIKPHIFRIITYILTLLLFFAAALFYRQPFLVMLFAMLFILPVFSIAAVYKIFGKISVSLRQITPNVTVSNDLKLFCDIQFKGILPVFSLKLTVDYFNLFYEKQPPFFITVSLIPGKSNSFRLEFATSKSGMASFNISEISLSDYLNLVEFYSPLECTLNLPVLPNICEIEIPEYSLDGEGFDDVDESMAKGSSSHEITGVRQYIPGDRLLYIHWKLSAKSDELMVKELSSLSERKLIVFPLLSRQNAEAVIRTYYSLGKKLNTINEPFVLRYFNTLMNEPIEVQVSSDEDLFKSLLMLYYASIPENPFNPKDIPNYILDGCSILFAEGGSISFADF